MTSQRAPAPDEPVVSKVKSPPPTAEQAEVMDEFKKALDKLSEFEHQAREVSKRSRAEIVRRKSIPQMRIPVPPAAAVKR